MNRTDIDWADFTWNPVTGCYHGCKYCYARRIAHRFRNQDDESKKMKKWLKKNYENGGDIVHLENKSKDPYPVEFVPTFHKRRLDQPANRKKPSKIFVGSMGDLFGDWVPNEWIEQVFEACREAPQHTYYFLTKNPKRYYNYFAYNMERAPSNWWIGASASVKTNAHTYSDLMGFMNANVFMSFEPLHEDIASFVDWENLHWVIVGAQTGPNAKQPKREWIGNLLKASEKYAVPIFLKDNLDWPRKVQMWP